MIRREYKPRDWAGGSERGSAVLFALVLLTMLFGLTAAQVSLQQKNISSSRFFASEAQLHRYAESGIALSVHDVNFDVTADPGQIGTANWDVTSMDLGADGTAQTNDAGEGDGLPTPGEPGIAPVSIGPSGERIQLIVHAFDPDASGVMRVVATSFNTEGQVTVEKRIQRDSVAVPRAGAVFVSPDVTLDFNGQSFMINGEDHNADGTLANNGIERYGLATSEGATPGENAANLVAQVPSNNYDQVVGQGGEPSVGEAPDVDLNALADAYIAVANNTASGTIASGSFGSYSTVTYADSGLHVTGNVTGTGVMVVDGDLEVTGQFTFTGLLIVRGDIRLSGGGARIHTIGAVTVSESITAIDSSDVDVSGTADLVYSSEALDLIESNIENGPYTGVYYDEDIES